MKRCVAGLALAIAAAGVGGARAQTAAPPDQGAQVFAGLFAHDVTFIGESLGIGAAGKEDGADIHLGVRSARLDALRVVGRPRAYVLGSLNTEGDTNFAAAGLAWTYTLGEARRFYVQPGIGLAYHDGVDELPDFRTPGLSPAEVARRVALRSRFNEYGSKVLFEPELTLGWRATERVAVELGYTHLSNGQILGGGGQNDGLDDVGLRVVVGF